MERTGRLVVGHGMEEGTTMGLVTTELNLARKLLRLRMRGGYGGRVILGRSRVKDTTGYFFELTIVIDATPEMMITQEEIFALVLALEG